MKRIELTRVSGFLLFFATGVVFYLLDCLFKFKEHPDLPWYETGIYDGRRAFLSTAGLFALAFFWLIFKKDK